jgi:16S rRNA (guanine(966)-N(2))-methyltransferase RsmD
MRIITGTARNTPLATLEGEGTRPTSERVKEALFSMFQFEIEGRRALDLFAGSGQLGLEALSRGAAHATFIDNTRAACDVIIANAKKARLFDRCRVSATEYTTALRGWAGKEKFDLIFLDPPYDYDPASVLDMVAKVAESGGLQKEAIVVYEHAVKSSDVVAEAADARGFEVQRFEKYGKTGVSTLIWE